MDNVCHTLVGAAFGETGLKSRTRFGNATLMIAANLPDVDVFSFLADTPAVALRRGITHGVAAQAVLPIALTAAVLVFDRWRPDATGKRARAAPLLLFSYIGILSHVGLDWLNNYGVRLLMPFSSQWFYGDSVFIVDPWLWAAVGLGVLLARRYAIRTAAAIGLIAATIYIAGMVISAERARTFVLDVWRHEHGGAPEGLMVGPSFLNPFRPTVIVDGGDFYRTGRFSWWPRRLALDDEIVSTNENTPAAIRAGEDPHVRAVLVWARFPYYRLAPAGEGTRVTLADMRFPERVGGISVFVPDADPPRAPCQ